MSATSARRLTIAVGAFVVALLVAGAVLSVANHAWDDHDMRLLYPIEGLAAIAFLISGSLIARRDPENPIGWIFLLISLGWAAQPFTTEYGIYGLVTASGSVPWPAAAIAISEQTLGTSLFPMILVLFLFPDGHLVSPRWRPLVWISAAAMTLVTLISLLRPHSIADVLSSRMSKIGLVVRDPFGIDALKPLANLGGWFGLMLGILAILSIVSLFVRRRRASAEQREQLRWLSYLALATVVWIVGFLILNAFTDVLNGNGIAGYIFWLGVSLVVPLGIPIACGIAILKYHLYDIDVVINKTVVYGLLAVAITLVYVGIVVGIGTLVGSAGSSNQVLSVAATAIVALAFQPMRSRLQRFANRLVYGKRATPYEVLSEFSDRLGDTYAADDLLPRMSRILAEATGAARADVWLHVGDQLRVEASWPTDLPSLPSVAAATIPLDVVPVRHQGELLGGLSVERKPGEVLSSNEKKLIHDLAAQAGLVLRNVRLIEEVKASRQRLVAAQDEERRKIERNIHDGAQQQLVALTVKLRLAEQFADRDVSKTKELLAQLQTDAAGALDDLRDLARGIYPPLLADKGLVAALESQARKSAVPVAVTADGIGRFDQDAEAAVYFCCLEALQNVAKYANATQAMIRLSNGDGNLTFSVSDDGEGFDPASTGYGTGLQGMADRLAALGGLLEIRSTPENGTEVVGTLPIREVTG